MSDYKKLVERCAKVAWEKNGSDPFITVDFAIYAECLEESRAVLAEVLRTLETVTPEMEAQAAGSAWPPPAGLWLAMLRASPLTPGRQQPAGSNITPS